MHGRSYPDAIESIPTAEVLVALRGNLAWRSRRSVGIGGASPGFEHRLCGPRSRATRGGLRRPYLDGSKALAHGGRAPAGAYGRGSQGRTSTLLRRKRLCFADGGLRGAAADYELDATLPAGGL